MYVKYDPNTVFDELLHIAQIKGGRVLSTKYVNAKTKMSFICRDGHRFDSIPDTIRNRNSWCKRCNSKDTSDVKISYLAEIKELAIKKWEDNYYRRNILLQGLN